MHAQQQRRRRQLMSTMHDKKLIAAFTLTSPSLCKCTIFIKIVSPTHKHTHTHTLRPYLCSCHAPFSPYQAIKHGTPRCGRRDCLCKCATETGYEYFIG